MSLPTALRFIEHVRRDAATRQAIAALGDGCGLDDIVQIGAAAGFSFTTDDLRAAHKHDWAMRWTRYHPRTNR